MSMPEYEPKNKCEHCGKWYYMSDGWCCSPEMCEVCGEDPVAGDYNGCHMCNVCLSTVNELKG